MPDDLEKVKYGQVGGRSERSEMVMGLKLAKAGAVAGAGDR